MDNGWLAVIIPFAFVPAFLTIWCTVCLLISWVGGWAQLKTCYRYELPFSGDLSYMMSGRFGWTNYSSVLTVGRSHEGLYLRPLFLFRPGHPPLLIPWEELTVEENKFLFVNVLILRTSAFPQIKIQLYRRDKNWLWEMRD